MTPKEYAIKCHADTNHLYDGKPYTVHLEKVVDVAVRFLHLIREPYHNVVIAACWCHDVIEDCRQTYNDVRDVTNPLVAEIVYALTNEKGKTRKDRANDKYYSGIKKNDLAVFVKLCDRIANAEYSKETGSRMLDVYRRENKEFRVQLYFSKFREMFDYLQEVLDTAEVQA